MALLCCRLQSLLTFDFDLHPLSNLRYSPHQRFSSLQQVLLCQSFWSTPSLAAAVTADLRHLSTLSLPHSFPQSLERRVCVERLGPPYFAQHRILSFAALSLTPTPHKDRSQAHMAHPLHHRLDR